MNPSSVETEARTAAARAVAAGPDVGEAHIAEAVVKFLFDWDWPVAESHLRRAVALNPSSHHGFWMLGHALTQQDRHLEAIDAAARALALDPLGALTHSMAAEIAYCSGRTDAAAAHAEAAVRLEPNFWVGQWQLGQAYERMGRTGDALEALNHAIRLSAGNSKPLSVSAYVLARIGRRDEAREVVASLERRRAETYVPPVAIALGYAALNDDTKAFEWLEQALAVRDVHLIYVRSDRKWDKLRENERFWTLMNRANRATGQSRHVPRGSV